MKWWKVALIVIAALAVGFCAGWAWEFYHSPLDAHICWGDGYQPTAPQYLAALIKSVQYELFWIGLTAAVAVVFGVPLWIIALRKRTQ